MNLYFRFLLLVLRNLIFPKKLDIFEESAIELKVLPNDLDLNMHMNNGRYLTIMDLGRTDFTMKLDLHKLMIKQKWGAVATAINVVYLRPLNLFDNYTLRTKLIAWDDKWFYMEQKFVKDDFIVVGSTRKSNKPISLYPKMRMCDIDGYKKDDVDKLKSRGTNCSGLPDHWPLWLSGIAST